MKRAITKLVAVMFERAGLQHLGPVITALRAAAVATCPEPDGRPAVRRACEALIAERASEQTTTALRQTFNADAAG